MRGIGIRFHSSVNTTEETLLLQAQDHILLSTKVLYTQNATIPLTHLQLYHESLREKHLVLQKDSM